MMGRVARDFGMVVAAGLATMSVSSAHAAPTRIWARSGVAASAMSIDLAECVDEAAKLHVADDYDAPYYGAGLIAQLAAEIKREIREAKLHARAADHCMGARQYHSIALDPGEARAYRAQNTAELKASWIAAFYARPDFTQRLNAAISTIVPQLPAAPAEPLAMGPVRLDPAVLTSPTGRATARQAVLSGPATHRLTARLTADVRFAAGTSIYTAPAGTVLQATRAWNELDPDATWWCGPIVSRAIVKEKATHCVFSDIDGYVVYGGRGADSVFTGPDDELISTHPATAYRLELSKEDLSGPIRFTLYLTRITDAFIGVQARVGLPGDEATLWEGKLATDSAGVAILPFWTHRLILTRANGGVTARFTPDGDGKSWADAKLAQ